MADDTRKTGSHQIPEEGAPEEEMMPSAGDRTKRNWFVDRQFENIERRLEEGNRQFSQLRTINENYTLKLHELELEFERRVDSLRRDLETKIQLTQNALDGKVSQESKSVATSIETLKDTVNPRVTVWKIIGYILLFIVPTTIAAFGWIWTAAKYPDRDEHEKLKDRVEHVERSEVEVRSKLGLPMQP